MAVYILTVRKKRPDATGNEKWGVTHRFREETAKALCERLLKWLAMDPTCVISVSRES